MATRASSRVPNWITPMSADSDGARASPGLPNCDLTPVLLALRQYCDLPVDDTVLEP